MAQSLPFGRRAKKPKVENLYKILGIRSNAAPDKIKKAYIEQVKQHPPEQFPDQFEQIRRAYETLRDPAKREQYDFMRKYGDNVEAWFQEAFECMERERYEQAEILFGKILSLSADLIPARIGLAQVFLLQNKIREFEEVTETALETAKSDADRANALSIFSKMLFDSEYIEQALVMMNKIRSDYKEYFKYVSPMYVQALAASGRGEEAWEIINAEIPSEEEQTQGHLSLFIEWINVLIYLEKWSLWGKISLRIKRYLKSLKDEDEIIFAVGEFMSESQSYAEAARFREAEMFVDFAYFLNPKNQALLTIRREIQHNVRLEKEIERLEGDQDIFPLVSFHAVQLYYEEFDEEQVESIEDEIPYDLLREFESMKEQYATGIQQLKKKYPLIYKQYQEEWEELYEEKTVGLNREARRRLSK